MPPSTFIAVEAPTPRATCVYCKVVISHGSLKLGYHRSSAYSVQGKYKFYHPRCLFELLDAPRSKDKIESVKQIKYLEHLPSKCRRIINGLIDEGQQKTEAAMKGGKKPAAKTAPAAARKTATKRKTTQEQTDSPAKKKAKTAPKAAVKAAPKTAAAKSPIKAAAKKVTGSKVKPSAKKVVKPAPKKAAAKPVQKKAAAKQAPKPAAVAAPPAPVAVGPVTKFAPGAVKTPVDKKKLSDEAKREFRNLVGKKLTVHDFSGFTVNDLKLVLKLNDRPTTGNKTELSKHLCDYMVNGCPPRCPKCGGGKLRVKKSGKAEEFYCPGYMEDEDFVNCNFKASSVARIPWKNP